MFSGPANRWGLRFLRRSRLNSKNSSLGPLNGNLAADNCGSWAIRWLRRGVASWARVSRATRLRRSTWQGGTAPVESPGKSFAPLHPRRKAFRLSTPDQPCAGWNRARALPRGTDNQGSLAPPIPPASAVSPADPRRPGSLAPWNPRRSFRTPAPTASAMPRWTGSRSAAPALRSMTGEPEQGRGRRGPAAGCYSFARPAPADEEGHERQRKPAAHPGNPRSGPSGRRRAFEGRSRRRRDERRRLSCERQAWRRGRPAPAHSPPRPG